MPNGIYTIELLAGLPTGMPAQHHDRTWLFGISHTSAQPCFGGAIVDFNFQPPRMAGNTSAALFCRIYFQINA